MTPLFYQNIEALVPSYQLYMVYTLELYFETQTYVLRTYYVIEESPTVVINQQSPIHFATFAVPAEGSTNS